MSHSTMNSHFSSELLLSMLLIMFIDYPKINEPTLDRTRGSGAEGERERDRTRMSPLRFLVVTSRRICVQSTRLLHQSRNLADHGGRFGFSGRLPMGDSLHGGVAAVGTLSAAPAGGMLYFKEDPREPAATYKITDEDAAMRRRFEEWMIKCGRRYKDKEEKALRYEAFKRNVKSTPETNAKVIDGATFGTNGLSDLTEEEWYPLCHGCCDISKEELLRHGISKEEFLRHGIIVDGKD